MGLRDMINKANNTATRVATQAATSAASTAVVAGVNAARSTPEQAPGGPADPAGPAADPGPPAPVLPQLQDGPVTSATGALEPIAGITLEHYGELAAKMADCNGDLEVCAQIA